MKNVLYYLLIAGIFIVVSNSCSLSTSHEEVSPNSASQAEVTVNNGRLIFRDFTTFSKIRENLSQLGDQEIDKWESTYSTFLSQRRLFNHLIEADTRYKESVDKLSSGEVEKLIRDRGDAFYFHGDVIQNSNILEFDAEGLFYLRVEGYDKKIEYFINPDGLVQIGDSIFQYKEGFIKIITNGDISKIAQLNEINDTEPDGSVLITRVKKEVLPLAYQDSEGKVLFSGNGNCTGYTTGGGQRVKGHSVLLTSQTTYSNNITVYNLDMYLRAFNEYNGVFGWRSKDTSQLNIQGVVNYGISRTGYPTIGETLFVNAGTGGQLKSNIKVDIYTLTNSTVPPAYDFYGSLTFQGRDGSTCSI